MYECLDSLYHMTKNEIHTKVSFLTCPICAKVIHILPIADLGFHDRQTIGDG